MDVPFVLATRYLTAIGVTCFMWDYLLVFNEEKTHVWTRSWWNATQHAFVWKRYTTFVGVIYAAILTSGLQPTMNDFVSRLRSTPHNKMAYIPQSCKVSYVTLTTLAIIAILASHGCTALRLVVLWDQKRWAKVALRIVSLVSLLGLLVFFCISVPELFAHATYIPHPVNMCALTRNPPMFVGIFVTMLCFDAATVLLFVANALYQPYKTHSQVVDRIRRDGAWSFLVVFVATIAISVVSETGPPGSIYEATIFLWALDAIIECRLAIRTAQVTLHDLTHQGIVHSTSYLLNDVNNAVEPARTQPASERVDQ